MPARVPPGPKGHFLTGNVREFRRDRLGLFLRCARDYGDVAAVRIGPIRGLVLSHPDAIEYVLVTNNHNFIKHFALRRNRLFLGNGLLTSEGDFWLRQRRLIQPAFNRRHLDGYGAVMIDCARHLLAEWRDGETRELSAEMTRLTLEIAARALFGAEAGTDAREVGEAMAVAHASFENRIAGIYPLPRWLPTPGNYRLQQAARRVDAIIYRFIAERRRNGGERDDVLSLLLRARDEDDGSRMTDKQLRDEAMTLFLAGHETTALALTWTGYLLAQHPEIAERLRADLAAVLGDRPPAVADLPRLACAERVVLEAMRLYPPVYAFGREALHDCEIMGYAVPRGTTVFMSQWAMHRDPRWFHEPEKFDPDRWADGLAGRLPKFAYFPFGGGPRVCIGNAFALMEAVLVLATLAPRYRFELVPGQHIVPWPVMTLRPKPGVRVVLRRV